MTDIYLAQNGQTLGPYSAADIRAQIERGTISPSDLGWCQGLPDWRPLSQLVPELPGASPFASPGENSYGQVRGAKSSGVATASLVIGGGGVLGWIAVMGAAVAIAANNIRDDDGVAVLLGLSIFAGVGLNIVGVVLGLMGLVGSSSNKWMAVVGLILNVLEVAAMVGIVMIGLSMKD